MKLCLGSGHHRFDGYIHVDFNKASNPDVVSDALTYVKDLPDNVLDNVIAWHVFEHIEWSDLQQLIAQLHRASKPGAVWCIRVPHCTSIHAGNPQHCSTYSTTFWDFWAEVGPVTQERFGPERLKTTSCILRILAHGRNDLVPSVVSKLMPNWVFNNFGRTWQMVCERFWPFRFDEIEWTLSVMK